MIKPNIKASDWKQIAITPAGRKKFYNQILDQIVIQGKGHFTLYYNRIVDYAGTDAQCFQCKESFE